MPSQTSEAQVLASAGTEYFLDLKAFAQVTATKLFFSKI